MPILAKANGLMCACKVLLEETDRIRVHVRDEKRPKWISKHDQRVKLFDDTDQAMAWIKEVNDGKGK